jgi:lambda repressor-like predicted transcriptional regulator
MSLLYQVLSPSMAKRPTHAGRDRLILALKKQGHSLSQLAERFDLSKSRISQIVNSHTNNED